MKKLTAKQIETLYERHTEITNQIRELTLTLDDINDALRTGELPVGIKFKDIGTPGGERPK